MTGYQYIKRMTVEEIDRALGCGRLTARNIKEAGLNQLICSCHTCPQLFFKEKKWPCNFQETKCKECMKAFLENEIPGTEPIIEGPCLTCMELDFCMGIYKCEKLEDYQNEKKRRLKV